MKSRTRLSLSTSVNQQLNLYALGAAAGVSLLAFAQPSEAKVVYTPTNARIGQHYDLDVNNDGITDFTIQDIHSSSGCGGRTQLFETPASGNGVIETGGWAAALSQGVRIHKNDSFGESLGMASINHFNLCQPSYRGPWGHVQDHYLGLRFKIHGRTHYGWARLSTFSYRSHIGAILTGYAYETIPNTPIIAGQTHGADDAWDEDDFSPDASLTTPIPDALQSASLGMLALGARGVPIWEGKEELDIAA